MKIAEGEERGRGKTPNVHIAEEPKCIEMAATLIIKGFSVWVGECACIELCNSQIKQYTII